MNPPTVDSPLVMACPVCEGEPERCKACDECKGSGEFLVTACPHSGSSIGRDGADAVLAADQAALGNWPVAGGWLDQSASALEAVRRVWSEEAHWKRQAEE